MMHLEHYAQIFKTFHIKRGEMSSIYKQEMRIKWGFRLDVCGSLPGVFKVTLSCAPHIDQSASHLRFLSHLRFQLCFEIPVS